MSQKLKNVLIIGAGGNLGPYILSAVDKASDFNVSVLSREGSKSTFPSHIKIINIADSFPEESLVKAFKGQDAVIDLAPGHETERRKASIDAAVKAGVKRYIPGEFGSNTEVPEIIAKVPMFHFKLAVRDYLKSKESEGLTWTGVINGAFFDWGIKNGFLGFDIKNKSATIYDSGDNYTDLTMLPTIGQAVVGVLRHPAETANRYVHVNSFHTTQNQILAALEKATNAKWSTEHKSCEEEGKRGRELLAKHDFSGFAPAILASEYSGADYMNFEKFGLWNEKFGLPKSNTEMEAAIKKIVEES